LQRAAAMKAGGPVVAYGTVALLCLLLAGCTSEPERQVPATAPAAAAIGSTPSEPELTAPEPEVLPPAARKPIHKPHKVHRPAHRGVGAVAKLASPPSRFRCHIVREADIEGAAGQASGTEPGKVDLYARIDPQAHTLSVERAGDPAFAQAQQHCGDGKPSPASVKKKYRGRRRSRH
jgi:hypothetical protein